MAALRWTLRVAGALLLVAMAVLHGRLWLDGYRSIDVIGPLFALDTVLAALLAIAVLLAPRRYVAVVALAGAAVALGTAAGLLLSTRVTLFGFRESLEAQDAKLSLVVEAAAGVVLVVLAVLAVRDLHRSPARTSPGTGARTARW
jgi:hypothetical protein